MPVDTALRHRTNPDCQAPVHGSANAARRAKPACECPEALAKLEQFKVRDRNRKRVLRDEDGNPVQDQEGPCWPETTDIGELGKALLHDPSAACRDHDPELWFSVNPRETAQAIRVCRTCPLMDSCLTVALRAGMQGVWGATTDEQRAAIRARWKRAG